MHCTFELYIRKKWNKIPQSSRFCPTVHCHGSQTPRFIWCSYNKLDFLGLVCMHIAFELPQIIEAPPCVQGWGVHLSRSAEKCGGLRSGTELEPRLSPSSCLMRQSGHRQDVVVCEEVERSVCMCERSAGEVKTFTWSQLKLSLLPLSSQLMSCFTLHPIISLSVKFDANFRWFEPQKTW